MKITTKFNVGDFVYHITDKQYLERVKIERIRIAINNENYCQLNKCNEVSILYELEGSGYPVRQDELFKDFDDFKKAFQIKFDVLEQITKNY